MSACEYVITVRVEAPRDQCTCRACFRARDALIPSRLVEMANDARRATNISSAMPIVLHWLNVYRSGRVDLQTAELEMIAALVAQNEKIFKDLVLMTGAQPIILTAPS